MLFEFIAVLTVRSKALQIAKARLWEDAQKLQDEVWAVAFTPGHRDIEYREALEKIEKAVSLEPDNFYFLGALAAVQYRLGVYGESLATLTRAEKTRNKANMGSNRGPVIDGLRAMNLRQLGRDKDAHAVIQQLRSGYSQRWFSAEDNRNAPFFLRLVIEVERLLAGEDITLLSVWKLIEEDKLDEASELIEKARLSKSPDYMSRMEGAMKLLEVLRNLK